MLILTAPIFLLIGFGFIVIFYLATIQEPFYMLDIETEKTKKI
jgi:hypothetical protein